MAKNKLDKLVFYSLPGQKNPKKTIVTAGRFY